MRIKPGFALLLLVAGGVFAQPVASKIGVGPPDANYRTAITGAAGKRQYFARQIVIQGEELQMPEQKAAPASPRRRAAK